MSGAAAEFLGVGREVLVAVVIFVAIASVALCGRLRCGPVLMMTVVLVAAGALSVIYMDAVLPGRERAL